MSALIGLPKILCVDDESSVLPALVRVLARDFHVLAAASAEQARDILGANPDIAIVLTDQKMPGESGLSFLEHVQVQAPDAVRAMLTAHVDIQEMMAAVNTSLIHRLILKPWDNDYLRVQMIESLASHTLMREKRELEQLSITDPVTLLRNHRYFQDRLRIEVDRALRHSRVMSLFMIDIDHFKAYNDQHGHPAGDALLRATSKRLIEEVRTIDTVARYGGEEFGIILPDTPFENAIKVAERLRLRFEKDSFTAPDGRSTFVTVSIGIAAVPMHATDAAALVQAADRALYQAKRQGRNQSVGASIGESIK